MGDASVGLQARLMSQAMRKLTGAISKSKCTVIFINQIREKIGVMFGNPETTPGGRALKFYSSIRIDVRRTQTIKDGETSIGARTRAPRGEKQDRAPVPRCRVRHHVQRRHQLRGANLLDLAVSCNVVDKSGAWFNYGPTRLGQGRENAKQFLFDNKDLAAEIHKKVLALKLAQPGEELPEDKDTAADLKETPEEKTREGTQGQGEGIMLGKQFLWRGRGAHATNHSAFGRRRNDLLASRQDVFDHGQTGPNPESWRIMNLNKRTQWPAQNPGRH